MDTTINRQDSNGCNTNGSSHVKEGVIAIKGINEVG
jgi:hypothetical protein